MSEAFVDDVTSALSPLLEKGYRLEDHRYYKQHFGNGWALLTRGEIRLRAVKDRGQWFLDVGSSSAPEDWFDARLVLDEIGVAFEVREPDHEAIASLAAVLEKYMSRWEILFLPSTFATARRSLRDRQIGSAEKRFRMALRTPS